uniref:Uncharacterized protein n=1 Tax=viral metagenome TaxID=1070528 RepID=A0A6C0EY99_9ZZZZ
MALITIEMKFCEIDIDELVKGKKYMIREIFYDYTRTTFSIFDHYETPYITNWNKTIYTILSPELDLDVIYANNIRLNNMIKKAYFYKLETVKEQIQNAMELRAVNLILQNITGDKTFIY